MHNLYVCYVDESGNGQILTTLNHQQNQPVLAISGLFIPFKNLNSLTKRFLGLKQTYFPPSSPVSHDLNLILHEIKGTQVRRNMVDPSRSVRRISTNFMKDTLTIIESLDAKISGKIYIKQYNAQINEVSMYSTAIQTIAATFQNFLASCDGYGIMILDSRDHSKNSNIAHSIFTQMFCSSGNKFSRIIEMPSFGISDNHAGLQICDLLCSSIIYPIVATSFLTTTTYQPNFVKPKYAEVKHNFAARIKNMQYRYIYQGKPMGGLIVSDPVSKKHGGYLFR